MRWLAVAAFLRGCAVMRLRFCGVAPWRGLAGCGGVSAWVRHDAAAFLRGLRCDVPTFLRGRTVAWAGGLVLRFCGVALCLRFCVTICDNL